MMALNYCALTVVVLLMYVVIASTALKARQTLLIGIQKQNKLIPPGRVRAR